MTLKELQKQVHETALGAGWYDGELGEKSELRIASMLCLVHSEVSEALEDLRENHMKLEGDASSGYLKPVGFPSELADAIIRILDMAEWLGIDLEEAILAKDMYNRKRSYRHGGKNL
jgi:NTP pyrophosphatase (non-canonical NTP hydrolase)